MTKTRNGPDLRTDWKKKDVWGNVWCEEHDKPVFVIVDCSCLFNPESWTFLVACFEARHAHSGRASQRWGGGGGGGEAQPSGGGGGGGGAASVQPSYTSQYSHILLLSHAAPKDSTKTS